MKKILAVSLCAIMAVSAARAEIASVEYVEKQTGTLSALTTTANGNLVGAINEVAGKANAAATQTALDNLSQTVATNESDIEGKVTALTKTVSDNKTVTDKTQEDLDALEETVAGLQGSGDAAAATKGELNALDTRVDTAEGEIDALQASLATGGDTQKAIAAAQAKADQGVVDAATAQAAAEAAQATADKAVVANAAITAGTATKITYDAKGLVTKGEALTADDIPTIPSNKVSGLGTLATKSTVASADITDGTVAKTDLATAVQTSLGLADTAVQPSAISDMQTKSNRLTTTDTTSITDSNKDTLYPTVGRTAQMINELSTNVTSNIDSLNTALTTLSNNTTTALSGKQATLTTTNVKSDGTGNVVTAVTAANGVVTVTKGTTLGSLATKSTVATADITDGAVTTAKIADANVTLGKLASNSVNSAKIVDASVAKEDLVAAVQTSLGLADTAMQESALKSLASWTSAKCGTTGVTCSLVSKDGTIAWEAVKY